jgi:molecular chaperone Hsp33
MQAMRVPTSRAHPGVTRRPGSPAPARIPRRRRSVAASADVLLRQLSADNEVSVLVVDGTSLVAEACARHGTAPTASAALGRALLGALLMSAFKGEGEATQLTFQGTGDLGGMVRGAREAGGAVDRAHRRPSTPLPPRMVLPQPALLSSLDGRRRGGGQS